MNSPCSLGAAFMQRAAAAAASRCTLALQCSRLASSRRAAAAVVSAPRCHACCNPAHCYLTLIMEYLASQKQTRYVLAHGIFHLYTDIARVEEQARRNHTHHSARAHGPCSQFPTVMRQEELDRLERAHTCSSSASASMGPNAASSAGSFAISAGASSAELGASAVAHTFCAEKGY